MQKNANNSNLYISYGELRIRCDVAEMRAQRLEEENASLQEQLARFEQGSDYRELLAKNGRILIQAFKNHGLVLAVTAVTTIQELERSRQSTQITDEVNHNNRNTPYGELEIKYHAARMRAQRLEKENASLQERLARFEQGSIYRELWAEYQRIQSEVAQYEKWRFIRDYTTAAMTAVEIMLELERIRQTQIPVEVNEVAGLRVERSALKRELDEEKSKIDRLKASQEPNPWRVMGIFGRRHCASTQTGEASRWLGLSTQIPDEVNELVRLRAEVSVLKRDLDEARAEIERLEVTQQLNSFRVIANSTQHCVSTQTGETPGW